MATSHTLAEQLTGLGSRLADVPDWVPAPDPVTKAACKNWAGDAAELSYQAILLNFQAEDEAYDAAVTGLTKQIAAIDAANQKIARLAGQINQIAGVISQAEKVVEAAGGIGLAL
jgi:hypothetical protein